MKTLKKLVWTLGLLVSGIAMQSCNDNDGNYYQPTALVTVHPMSDGTFVMHLDDSTVLYPTNIKSSPFGEKEVRALLNYAYSDESKNPQNVFVHWIDSIRTKMPVPSIDEEHDKMYGNDPIEIVKDWVTVAEDGYLTLRIRTRWGISGTTHLINLLTGTNPENPYELELRHNAQGDTNGKMGDALIAFNLNGLKTAGESDIRIKLNWESFSGKKNIEFDLRLRPTAELHDSESITFNKRVE